MNSWPYRPLSDFLIEREGRFKPNDSEIASYKRLDKIDFSGNIHISEKPSKTDMIIIEPGDLVISGINVAKGALAVYEGEEPVIATIHYSSYTFNKNKIDIAFLKRFLKSPAFISELQDQVKGGIKTEIKPKHLLPLKARIPELAEQHKINNYFDAIDNEISDLSNEVNTQSSYLTKLRQAILQEAIQGKLSADWRKKNPVRKGDPDYDAESLLEKIQAEKEKLIKDGKIKKQKPLAPIKGEEVPFGLPKGWVWTRLGEIAESLSTGPFGSMLHKSDYVTNGIPIVNPMNLSDYGIVADNRMMVSDSTANRLCRYKLKENDLIIARRGNLSKCCIVFKDQENWLCGTGSFFMRLMTVNIHFFVLVYRSKVSQSYLLQDSIGQTMDNLNQKLLSKLPIALPPIAEQQAIVNRVENILSMVDELEKQVFERKEQSEQLMQAVLREAFEGGNHA